MEKIVIGWVGVDSGQLLVGDPCYLGGWVDNEYGEGAVGEYSYGGACATTDDELRYGGSIRYEAGHEGRATVFRSGLGDGFYPVVGHFAEVPGWGRRVTKVEIIMVPDGMHPYELNGWEDYFEREGISDPTLAG